MSDIDKLKARVAELEEGIRNCRAHAVDNGVCTPHFNNHVHSLLTRTSAQSLARVKAECIDEVVDEIEKFRGAHLNTHTRAVCVALTALLEGRAFSLLKKSQRIEGEANE